MNEIDISPFFYLLSTFKFAVRFPGKDRSFVNLTQHLHLNGNPLVILELKYYENNSFTQYEKFRHHLEFDCFAKENVVILCFRVTSDTTRPLYEKLDLISHTALLDFET